MKLSKCTHGVLVITDEDEIGMVVGVTYNVGVRVLMQCGQQSNNDLKDMTIPLVQFPTGTRGINHRCLELYKD